MKVKTRLRAGEGPVKNHSATRLAAPTSEHAAVTGRKKRIYTGRPGVKVVRRAIGPRPSHSRRAAG